MIVLSIGKKFKYKKKTEFRLRNVELDEKDKKCRHKKSEKR